MNRRTGAMALVGIVAMALLLSAIPMAAARGDASGLYGGTLQVAVKGAISLNPFTATDANSWTAIPLVYDSLARIDPVTLLPVSWAAASWAVDGTSLDVTLRSDLAFHDGTAVTAADVVYSYNQYKTAGMVPSDLTVTSSGNVVSFTSASGAGLFVGSGLTLPIAKSGTAAAPVGSGPFTPPATVSMPLTLTANAAHFRQPYVDAVTFTAYADTTAATVALFQDNVDLIGWTLGVDEPAAIVDVGGVNKTLLSDATVVANPGLTHLVAGFNMRSGTPTSDDALRYALANTLNPALALQIHPITWLSKSPVIQQDTPWYDPSVATYQVTITVDTTGRSTALLTQSNQFLDEGGYLDVNGDGYREAPDGSALTLTAVGIPVGESARVFTVQEASVDVFTRLGLRVSLVSVPSADLPARLLAGDFDIFFASLPSALDPGFLRTQFDTAGATNYAGISNATLDDTLDSADAALGVADRQAAVFDAQEWIMSEGFYVPLFHFNAIEATARGTFDGWVVMPGGINNFWSYMSVHKPLLGALSASLAVVPNSLKSGETATVLADIVDQDGFAVSGATVVLSVDGTVADTATTDATGRATFDLTAPSVQGATDLPLSVAVSQIGYASAQASTVATVHPDIAPLHVAVASDALTIKSGESAQITVTVTSSGAAVSNAKVVLEVQGYGGSLDKVSGTTDAAGHVTATFTGTVGPRSQFRILATATAAGYASDQSSTTLVVEQNVGSVESRTIPGLDWGLIVVAIAAIAVIAGIAVWAARRK